MKEEVFQLPGKKIAAIRWGKNKSLPILALHGWLDNAASFNELAPLIPNYDLVAIDLPGHGLSDHQPKGTYIHLIDYVVTAMQVVHELKWERFALLGHSLGAAIACLIAGTFPERILGIGLIDGLGPFTTPPELAPKQLRTFIDEIIKKPHKVAPHYLGQEDALNARLKVNKMLPKSGQHLVDRGTKQLHDGKWTWRTDPRLLLPPALQLTEAQVLAFLSAISAPVCLIHPDQGFPFDPVIMQARYNTIKQINLFSVAGNHHVHLDSPIAVADYLRPFFNGLQFSS